LNSKIELNKSKLRYALQSAPETSWRELGTAQESGSARERESGRAVQLDSGADPDSPDSGPEHLVLFNFTGELLNSLIGIVGCMFDELKKTANE